MKQLVCEMCGCNDLLKQDGVFVCQSCGCKYSVEEAKKMMAGIDSTPAPKNSAQLENLLTLARSSFDSKNYAQAEQFCNQVIALDGINYDAWKLKGESINYQINPKNRRILEVFNCLITSYRILDDEQKAEKKHDILFSLKTCFESEVEFWINQFEAQRPTNEALANVQDAYIDAYDKMSGAFCELGFEEMKDVYLINFDNMFIEKCSAICNSAWESTVGYNYYRHFLGKEIDPFRISDPRWVIPDSRIYVPSEEIWNTFLVEADNLINLLQFAENRFNDDTNPKIIETIYTNIAFLEECIIPSSGWIFTQGYASKFDQYPTVGWKKQYCLSDSNQATRKAIMNRYKEKARKAPKEAEARQRAKQEKERKERIAKYWEEHANEKAALDKEQADLNKKIEELNSQISAIEQKNDPKLAELRKERYKKLQCEIEVDAQRSVIRNLEAQRAKCGIFKRKEKKAIQARLDTEETPKLNTLQEKAKAEKKAHQDKINAEINAIQDEGKELRNEVAELKKRSDEITNELTKDR